MNAEQGGILYLIFSVVGLSSQRKLWARHLIHCKILLKNFTQNSEYEMNSYYERHERSKVSLSAWPGKFDA